MSYDPEQRFISLVPGGNGIFYGIQADGELYWYRHFSWADGNIFWANNGNGRLIGTFWHDFRLVLAGAEGQLFAFRPNGDLLWYQYVLTDANSGEGFWHSASGSQIGFQWNFPRIIGGWNNVLYGLDGDGRIFWYRYVGSNGSVAWAQNSGAQIGAGWQEFPHLFADPNGVIFGAHQDSSLRWWRYLGEGAPVWANNGNAIEVGIGWASNRHKQILSNTNGVVYAVELSAATVPGPDGALKWYRLANSDNIDSQGVNWVNNGNGAQVGSGFTQENSAALQGYPGALSTQPGQGVSIHVSTTYPSYTSTTVRIAPATGDPIPMTGATPRTGQFKPVQNGYRSNGCGWSADFTASVAANWPSGVYASRLESGSGVRHQVMFVVRPATPQQNIAVLLPTNTYNAYNTWGGHNQYSIGQDGVQRTVTLARPSNFTHTSATGVIDHLLYSDLFLWRWLSAENIAFDCYTDSDLHSTGGSWLPNYRALVLTSHPEYMSQAARQNIVNFQNAGGRLIYTGGNGIYERVSYSANGQAVVFRRSDGERDLFEESGQSESQILGVALYPPSYMDFAPYQVRNNHPFLAGTGLSIGSTFGSVAYNGAASGWELDTRVGPVPGGVLIAEGLNPEGGAEMMYVPKPNGGWVFSASSMSFNGAIPRDPALAQLLRNVFAAAVA
ncbi:MAG: hypothetical protein HOQ05_08135 [Corynebacteriales bacterium]|nr:hypothetical protein [Mycobacteriales bacterium]